MSHAVRRPLSAAVVATCSLALVGAPAAGAKTTKLSKTDKAQNTAIKKVGKTANSANKTAKSAVKSAKTANSSAAAGLAAAAAAAKKADGAQGGVNAVLAGVPQITDGLKQLADGLTQAAAGLTALKDGLTTVGNALAAQEYGTVKLQLGTTDVPGAVFNSSDIPDDSNAATLTVTTVVPVPNGATNVAIHLLAGVRSGESDGTGANDPVASAGIVSMTATAITTGTTVAGGNPGFAALPLASAANADAGGAPVYPIPLKAPRVDATPNPFSFPDADAIDLTDPTTLQTFTATPAPFNVSNVSGATGVVTVSFTVRFNDLTASATDVTA